MGAGSLTQLNRVELQLVCGRMERNLEDLECAVDELESQAHLWRACAEYLDGEVRRLQTRLAEVTTAR